MSFGQVVMNTERIEKPRLVFIANSMYSNILSGGEVHTSNLANSALAAGYRVHFLCGHALKAELERRQLPVTISLTDKGMLPPRDFSTLGSQLKLLADYFVRYRGSMQALGDVHTRMCFIVPPSSGGTACRPFAALRGAKSFILAWIARRCRKSF